MSCNRLANLRLLGKRWPYLVFDVLSGCAVVNFLQMLWSHHELRTIRLRTKPVESLKIASVSPAKRSSGNWLEYDPAASRNSLPAAPSARS